MHAVSSDQRGFTLVELLVSMMLGLVVLGALFSLVDATGHSTKKTMDRVDSAQRGRTAMEQTIQQLRATVCVPGPPSDPGDVRPFVAASPTSVTWYANLDNEPYASTVNAADDPVADPDGNGDPTFDPHLRRLTYVPAAAGAPSQLVSEIWPDTAGTGTPKRRVLLTDLAPVSGSGIFKFGAYADTAGLQLEDYVPGDRDRIVRVDVAFTVRPTAASRDLSTSTTLRSSAYARVVNRNTSPEVPFPTYGCTT